MGMTYQRGAVWWVKYYRNGRAMRESTGSAKESDAIRLLKIREGGGRHAKRPDLRVAFRTTSDARPFGISYAPAFPSAWRCS